MDGAPRTSGQGTAQPSGNLQQTSSMNGNRSDRLEDWNGPDTQKGEAPCVDRKMPPLSGRYVRRCPTLPHPGGCSTIGAERLSFRVRNGTGRFPHAITAETITPTGSPTDPFTGPSGLKTALPAGTTNHFVVCCLRSAQWTRTRSMSWCWYVVSPRPISTSQLHTSRCFHFWPINPVV